MGAVLVAIEQARHQSAGFWTDFGLALSAARSDADELRRFIRSANHDAMAGRLASLPSWWRRAWAN